MVGINPTLGRSGQHTPFNWYGDVQGALEAG